MKQHPILFSTPMVQAIMAGNKTQTRRIITKHRSGPCDTAHKSWLDWDTIYPNNPFGIKVPSKIDDTVHRVYPPYEVGDHLWVRETFHIYRESYIKKYSAIIGYRDAYKYKADRQPPYLSPKGGWKPSIFMPREASRITLEVTDIRVERLQEVSREDAMAEGVERWVEERMRSRPIHYKVYYHEPGDESSYSSCPIVSFETLWQSINGPGSWEANPWVWKTSFKRIES